MSEHKRAQPEPGREPRKPTRKGSTPIVVRVLPDEKLGIEEMARATGNTTAGYLRKVGLGYEVRTILDYERAQALVKINGDLGRLGGLLKHWLAGDKRLAGFTADDQSRLIIATLMEIEKTQKQMREVIKKVAYS